LQCHTPTRCSRCDILAFFKSATIQGLIRWTSCQDDFNQSKVALILNDICSAFGLLEQLKCMFHCFVVSRI
jgi:hypothetical protein